MGSDGLALIRSKGWCDRNQESVCSYYVPILFTLYSTADLSSPVIIRIADLNLSSAFSRPKGTTAMTPYLA
jgi:hypothetical protein